MALLDIVATASPGIDPIIYVDRPDTVPSGIVVQTSTDFAITELKATIGGGAEQVSFYTL